MTTDWIKGEDGELYPAEKIIADYRIGSYRADKSESVPDTVPVIDDTVPVRVAPATTLNTGDARLKVRLSKVKSFLAELEPFVWAVMWVLLLILYEAVIFLISPSPEGKTFDTDKVMFHDIAVFGIGAVLSLASVAVLYFVNDYYCGLRAYGLKKKAVVWTINIAEEKIVPVVLKSVFRSNPELGIATFMSSEFLCYVEGEECILSGFDIYLSEADAQKVLDFVLASNDYELSKIYPDWKKDKAFVGYYKELLIKESYVWDIWDNRRGYGLPYSTTSTIHSGLTSPVSSGVILADELHINGRVYKHLFSAMKVFGAFLEKWKNNEHSRKEKENKEKKFAEDMENYQKAVYAMKNS